MWSLTVLQISLSRCGLCLPHPTRTVWPAGHHSHNHIQGRMRSFLQDLRALSPLLSEHFIIGHTTFLYLLLTAEKLQETPLGKGFLQDFAYLSLLMLLTILPSTHTNINFFSLSRTGVCLSCFIGSMSHKLEGSFLCTAGLWMGRGPAVGRAQRSIDTFVPNIFSSS